MQFPIEIKYTPPHDIILGFNLLLPSKVLCVVVFLRNFINGWDYLLCIKIKSPASAESERFICLEPPGSTWPQAFRGFQSEKTLRFCTGGTSLFYFTYFTKEIVVFQ